MGTIRDLMGNASVVESAATTATGTTSVNGAVVDMAGWEGVVFIVKYSTAAANNTLKVQQGTDATVTDAADLEGTSVSVGASDEVVWCQIREPEERYLRPVYLRGTSTVLEWAVAIKFGGNALPADNETAGTIAGERHTRPAEGTA